MARNKQLNIDDRKAIQNGLDDGKTFTGVQLFMAVNVGDTGESYGCET